ncbi:MAG: DUF5343 domain-containing protein [Pseudonocardiaceae bacterium]
MVMRVNGPAAYGPGKTVKDLIERFRDSGLPSTLTVESLQRVGVSESLAPRTLRSLKLLDLVDEQGKPTPQFEDLRRAPAAQFKAELVVFLKSVYSDVFELLEPANATYEKVQDAFRSFTPPGQRDRMVSLFLSLLEYAEYSDTLPPVRSSNGARSAGRNPKQARTGHNGTPAPRVLPARSEAADTSGSAPSVMEQPGVHGDTYTVTLASGGTVSVVVDVNLFDLTTSDRNFVIDLVDKLKGYVVVDGLATTRERVS